MTATPDQLATLRDTLTALAGHDNALIRSAIRIALTELDLADLAPNPEPHLRQVVRILDAILNPDDGHSDAEND